MAHGFLKQHADVNAKSAGVETHGLNPFAVEVMADIGIDISGHTSNLVDEYLDESFDVVLTVCDHAAETCPMFPGNVQRIHRNIVDPSKDPVTGERNTNLDDYRKTREEIREMVGQVVEELRQQI